MGYEEERFVASIDGKYFCSICRDVVEKPKMIKTCKHLHCSTCIEDWIRYDMICPYDRQSINRDDIIEPSNVITSYLNNLDIMCQFSSLGCDHVCKVVDIENHENNCPYNSDLPIKCVCNLYFNETNVISHRQSCRTYIKIRDQINRMLEELNNGNVDPESTPGLVLRGIGQLRDFDNTASILEERTRNSFFVRIRMKISHAFGRIIREYQSYRKLLIASGLIGAGVGIVAVLYLSPVPALSLSGLSRVATAAFIGALTGTTLGYCLIKVGELITQIREDQENWLMHNYHQHQQ